MIYFHYCQTYNPVQLVDNIVKKHLNDLTLHTSLKGIGKISAFTNGLYVLRTKAPYSEVIIEERKIEVSGHLLTVYFVRRLKNGLQDYVEIRDGKWLEYNPLPEKEIQQFKTRISQNYSHVKEEQKMQPPAELLNWQNNYRLKVEYDVYESEEWVRFALNSSIDEGMKDNEVKVFRLLLNDIFEKNDSIKSEILATRENEQIIASESNDLGVVYSKINVSGNNIYLLHKGANTKTQNSSWLRITNIDNYKTKKYDTIKDVSSNALRAYPKWALKDSDLWTKIEKNNEMGNLSLLPEQTEFLKNFKFPKYINGQAGSGKSTMLYYLFANAYYYKSANDIIGDIIFLTENEKLLEHTKKSVIELLQINPEFDLSSEDVAIANVEKHFYPFQKFLLSLLPAGNSNFSPNKYLSFSKFKIYYEESNIAFHIKNKFSAELVWFIISTYVYGHNLTYKITSDNYEEKMPKEGKEIVNIEGLRTIEKEIIKPFYEKLLNDGYWDKIKLIKYIDENVEINKHYEVIFCDEAQDFSRVELEFILNMSIYTQYNLEHVKQFPIVFAGDALQTVNPTGFSSKVLTAMLYRELTNEAIGFNLDQDQLVFTPTYNYRSSQTIVNIANSIQYYRKNQFSADIQSPQISKRPVLFAHEHLNVFVDWDDFINDEELKRKVEFKTIIVPVNFDELEEYKKQHPALAGFNNLISAVDAKGIDFSEVVVYGFGAYKANKALKGFEESFFFNKLYVAVTRAQSELVIIDSPESKDNFWIPIINDYIKSDWAKLTNIKHDNFADIIVFDSKQVITSSTNVLADDAHRQKEQGILEKNIPLLLVASNHFIKIGNKVEYYLCLGEIQEIKGDWIKASEYYLKKDVGKIGYDKASNSYWQGKLWSEFLDLSVNFKSIIQKIRRIIALTFYEDKISLEDLKFLFDKKDKLNTVLTETKWRDEIIAKFLQIAQNSIYDEEFRIIIELFEYCGSDSDKNIWRVLGEIYFQKKRFEACINSYDRINEENEHYFRSKLEIAQRKNNIEEIIFWSGRLAIDANIDKSDLLSEIVHYYNENKAIITQSTNVYLHQIILFAFLIKNPHYTFLLEIAHKAEESFSKVNREIEMYYGFCNLLKSNKLSDEVISFSIERLIKNGVKAGILLDELNSVYEELSVELGGLKFIPYTDVDVDNIPTFPETIYPKFPNLIRNIQITNFRKFKDLTVENLGLFNLVVGDNNIGKTSFLEALLFIPEKEKYLERLAFAYIERTNIHPDKSSNSKDTNLYYNLNEEFVCDFENCEENNSNIKFSMFDKRSVWSYELGFKNDISDDNKRQFIKFSPDDYDFLKQLPYENNLRLPLISYGKGFSRDLAQAYLQEIQNNSDPNVEEEFIERIKLFIPNLQRITANPSNGVIAIRDSQFPNQIRPLHQYGDGANKLFRILVLLTIHKGKRLLIDEIDAGIHYSRFKVFWQIILKIAMIDNTQVFASTHNEECIEYFKEVLMTLGEPFKSESRVVQMKMLKKIKVYAYKFESFNLAIEEGIELRGGTEQ